MRILCGIFSLHKKNCNKNHVTLYLHKNLPIIAVIIRTTVTAEKKNSNQRHTTRTDQFELQQQVLQPPPQQLPHLEFEKRENFLQE
jgi:hypothetical protein